MENVNNNIMSADIKELSTAFSKAQAEINLVYKDKFAKFAGGYAYSSLASCMETIREPLSRHGLSIIQPISTSQDGQNQITTCLMHSSGQWIKSTFSIQSVIDKAIEIAMSSEKRNSVNVFQIMGSGITYARRYALSSFLGLAQDDDDDGQSMKEEKPQSRNITLSKQFATLCKDSGIDVKEFAKKNNISSNDIKSLENAIENFDSLKKIFENENTL